MLIAAPAEGRARRDDLGPAAPPSSLTLVSHRLCPYVQRAAITLAEKQVAFERIDVDLAAKPAWFLAVSPLGKTPVLLVGEAGAPQAAVFESAVICEYLDETVLPPLHPTDALERARHRGWIECASNVLSQIAAFYRAADAEALEARAREMRASWSQVETVLHSSGPYFAGERFSLVDAAFAPAFRYFDAFDGVDDFGILDALPRIDAWRVALSARPSVRGAVGADYETALDGFLRGRSGELARRMQRRSSHDLIVARAGATPTIQPSSGSKSGSP